jgi:membrane protease YdiL (CAAX protease family)
MPRKLANTRNLLTSLVLVFPLLIVYQIGVLYTLPMLNGADFLTTLLFRTLGLSVQGYLIFVGAVVVLFAVAVSLLHRRQRFDGRMVLPVLMESSIYALTMGSVIVLVMTKLLGISPRLAATLESQGMLTRLIMSVGAGVYEETVFRLGLLGGLAVLFERVFGVVRWAAVLAAFLLSAAAFSAVHHLPPYGDPLTVGLFTFRLLAGVFFGLLFWFRGFAVAVYTHALYDVYVLLVR